MTGDEHCAKCDTKLGKHRFVSTGGQHLLCGRCAGHKSHRYEDAMISRSKLRRGTHR